MSAAATAPVQVNPVLAPASGNKLFQVAAGVAAVGVALSGAAAFVDKERFAYAYLVGFMFVVTLGLGGLFFVMIQHLTRAGWSVGPRRQMEWLSGVLPVTVVLFAPLVFFSHDIWHHWMAPEGDAVEEIAKKAAYLNPTFFFIRAAIYFAIWTALSAWFWSSSRKQDESGDSKLMDKMAAGSAPGIFLFGLTITFAGFDWMMSLSPEWYSTIYGVYVFAGAAVSSMAALALMTLALQPTGLLGKVNTIEHQHDIGKLLFGFTVFWAYIGFSQFVLIWYANIPEETIFYRMRWHGDWKLVSLGLLFGHFILPFIALLSRHMKRNRMVLGSVAAFMLFMHWIDLYWLVMPNHAEDQAIPGWVDLAGLLGPLGIGAVMVALRAKSSPVYALKDPRLVEATHNENL